MREGRGQGGGRGGTRGGVVVGAGEWRMRGAGWHMNEAEPCRQTREKTGKKDMHDRGNTLEHSAVP